MAHQARFRIRQRVLVWHDALPAVRFTLALALIIASLLGVRHWRNQVAVAGPTASHGVGGAAEATPPPTPTLDPSASPTPTFSGSPSPTPAGGATVTPTPTATPIPTPTPTAEPLSTLRNNEAPLASAGVDQVVTPGALVILDGTGSFDPNTGDTTALSYSWRQISGPDVTLLSDRTAQPSFTAGAKDETYIFSVTIRDPQGASAIDTVTVATRATPRLDAAPITSPSPPASPPVPPVAESVLVTRLLRPANYVLFVLAVLATGLLLVERLLRSAGEQAARAVGVARPGDSSEQGRVIHHKTGDPIAGALVLIYGADGKLRARETTNQQGVFPTFFPPGQYSLSVQAKGFAFAPAANRAIAPAQALLYSGGTITMPETGDPLQVVIPMKPTSEEVSRSRVRLLHAWQIIQQAGRVISWPLFVAGALLNTVLVFLSPAVLFLVLEAAYVGLVIVKIALEVQVRPAYGQVRDAITHIPLDLAVVRLFNQENNRLIMTRVTNTQGKFFALPPAGTYRVTIAKPGYAMFSKDDITIASEHDTTLQMTADLMPVAPRPAGGLAAARAAAL